MTRTGWTTIATASLIAGLMSAGPALAAKPPGAQAARPTMDYFSAGASPSKIPLSATTGSFPDNSNGNSVAVKWFEQLDDAIFTHRPTAAERVTLSRPFNQDSERVEEWSRTAARVAKRYRELAKILRAMTVPGTIAGVKEFRDSTANWYDDAAGIYEELIKPRPPARTMEELDAALDEIKERAQSLADNNKDIKALELSLRKTYRVHLARYDDALQQYVRARK